MVSTIDLSGHCALVTGAARGIGKAIALALAETGANVAVNYRDREQNAQGVVDAIRELGRKAIAVRADVSDGAAVTSMKSAIERELGRVDVLINNAGIALHRGLDELDEPEANPNHRCHQRHRSRGGRSARRPRGERHHRGRNETRARIAAARVKAATEGSDGRHSSPTSHHRHRCANWPVRRWVAIQDWTRSSTTPAPCARGGR